MSRSYERCEDCQELIKQYGLENLVICEFCDHVRTPDGSIGCACEEDAE